MPLHVLPSDRIVSKPFHLHVTDAAGNDLPGIRVVSDNGIVCRTRPDGSIRWTEASLMGREVKFHIATSSGNESVTLHVAPGLRAAIMLRE